MSESNLEPSAGNVTDELRLALDYLFGIAESKNLSLTSHLIDAAKKSLDLRNGITSMSKPKDVDEPLIYLEGPEDD